MNKYDFSTLWQGLVICICVGAVVSCSYHAVTLESAEHIKCISTPGCVLPK